MEFDLPLRIHWRLGDHVSEDLIRSILEVSPLAVTLEVQRVEQLSAFHTAWDGVSIVIIYRGWRTRDRDIPAQFLGRWEFPIDNPAEARVVGMRSFFGLPPSKASFRWFPRRGQLKDLVPILQTVRESGCGLTLPNRPADVITSEGSKAFPGVDEITGDVISQLRGYIGKLGVDRVRIHDFILNEALGLKNMEPQGCEAANSIVFIDNNGFVYPCETLMVPMGDLKSMGLEEIWASPLRKRILRDVGAAPGVCAVCPDFNSCRGGCRGAAYHLKGHYGGPDPLCPADTAYQYE